MRLRPVACPLCGAPGRLSQGETSTSCSRCHAEITIESARLLEARRGRQYPNRTPIKVGMRATLNGRDYEVIGRMVYAMIEEGVAYYWDEWQLVAPDGHVLYLESDEGHWKLMEPFVPKNPLSPTTAASLPIGATVHLDEEPARLLQRSKATLCHVEGELTFAATIGTSRPYVDLGGLKHVYAVEWDEEEIEFYRGEHLPYRQVLVAFNLHNELKALDAAEERQASQRMFALICLTAAIVAMCGWVLATRPGRLVGRGGASIARISEDGLRFGPYALSMRHRVYRLRITASLQDAAAWVGAGIESADEREVVTLQRDMWDERGYDSDGHWHEWVLDAQTDFSLARTGDYFVRLYAEWEGPTGASRSSRQHVPAARDPAALNSRAAFELYEGVLYPWYLAWFCLASLFLALLFFLIGSPETRRKIGEAMSSSD